MKGTGIDISKQQSRPIDEALQKGIHLVITLCDNHVEFCPLTPPGIRHLHWSLPDPAKASGSEEALMNGARKVREEIQERIKHFLKEYS